MTIPGSAFTTIIVVMEKSHSKQTDSNMKYSNVSDVYSFFFFTALHCQGLNYLSHSVNALSLVEMRKEVPLKLGVSLRELVQSYVHSFIIFYLRYA